MKLVLIESPYGASDPLVIDANVSYARRAVRDSVLRGESPIASHLLFTQPGILKDEIPKEREMGIAAGLAWRAVAHESIFYTDRGWSKGMLAALWGCLKENRVFTIRAIDYAPFLPSCLCEDMEKFIKAQIDLEYINAQGHRCMHATR